MERGGGCPWALGWLRKVLELELAGEHTEDCLCAEVLGSGVCVRVCGMRMHVHGLEGTRS